MNYEKLANNKVFLALFKNKVEEEKVKSVLAYLFDQDWNIDDIQAAVNNPAAIDLTAESPDIIVFNAILERNRTQSNTQTQATQAQPIVVQATLNAPVDYSSMSVKQLINEAFKTGFSDENLISLIQEKIGGDFYVAQNKDGSFNSDGSKLVLQLILQGKDPKSAMLPSGVSLKKITTEEIKTYTLPNGKEVSAKLNLVAFVYFACEEENGYTNSFLKSLLENPQGSDYWSDWENLDEERQDSYKEKVRAASKKKHRPSLAELLAEDNPDNFQPRPQVEISSKPFPTEQEIHKAITTFFDYDEVIGLCFDLGIDHEQIAGSTKDKKTRELILFIKRGAKQGVTLDTLVSLIRRERRNINI